MIERTKLPLGLIAWHTGVFWRGRVGGAESTRGLGLVLVYLEGGMANRHTFFSSSFINDSLLAISLVFFLDSAFLFSPPCLLSR